MKLTHLSATSLKVWKGCQAEWADRYAAGNRGGDSNEAADLGKTIHEVLEEFITSGDYLKFDPLTLLWDRWDNYSRRDGINESTRLEWTSLLRKWHEQQDWDGIEVVSAERRWEFPLKTKYGDVPMQFVIDRVDRTRYGLEIHDYKSGKYQLNYDMMKDDLQTLTYATACWLEVPDQPMYWVTFDYLRDEPIGISFKPERLEAFYKELCGCAELIIETELEIALDNPTPYPGCRFCHKILDCPAVTNLASIMGYISNMTPGELALRRVRLSYVEAAVARSIKLLNEGLTAIFEADETLDKIVAGYDPYMAVGMSSSSRRGVDMAKVRALLSNDELAPFAKGVTIENIEKMIRDAQDGGNDERAQALRKTIIPGRTRPTIKVLP